jgi:hypothetical protein
MKELTDADLKEIARLDAEIEHLESELGLRIALREVVRTGKGYPPEEDAGDAKIQSLVRRQIVYYLKEGLEGGELLMKEVWEQCETDDDVVAAKHELEEIIEFLRDRDRRHGEGHS